MIDLCKIFGVEEGEEFVLKHKEYRQVYKVSNNTLLGKSSYSEKFYRSDVTINNLCEVIKLPKKKEFTDDELCILRNIDKKYKWIARDENGSLCLYYQKPKKSGYQWDGKYKVIEMFDHLFNSILWEDEEPVYIDDYVERGVE
jgi:hypothetical protein